MGKQQCVGIDVGAKSLAVGRRDSKGRVRVREIPNTLAGHKAVCASLANGPVKVCMEATGIYHLDIALALKSMANVDVMVANPRAVHDFAGALMTRGKTDASDAEVLVVFAERMPWQSWHAPSGACFELRTLCRHTVSLRKQLTAEKTRLARAQATESVSSWVHDDIAQGIEQLVARINKLQAAALELIATDAGLQRQFSLLCTIPGIAATSGVQLLSELCVLPSDMTARQWVAHAGLDPRRHESGTSVNKPPRITKAGNSYVRRALYMPALVAVRNNPHIAGFYEQLVGRGKKKLQALVAVMRKLLHAVWGMLRADRAWDGSRFYQGPLAAQASQTDGASVDDDGVIVAHTPGVRHACQTTSQPLEETTEKPQVAPRGLGPRPTDLCQSRGAEKGLSM